MAKMGGGKALLLIRNDIRQQLGKRPGDSVDVVVELDDKPREIAVPDDLKNALEAAKAWDAFEALAFTHRREYVQWIESAKKPETPTTRIAKTYEMVARGQKSR